MRSIKTSKLFNRNTFIIAFITIGLFTVYLIRSYELNVYKNISKSFLDNIIEENYEEAFQYIIYPSSEDSNRTEDLHKAWIEKMKKHKQEGTYIKSYNNIKMYFEDRYLPRGNVELVIYENNEIRTYNSMIFFHGKEISEIHVHAPTLKEIVSLDNQ